jgi:hypothetical protein
MMVTRRSDNSGLEGFLNGRNHRRVVDQPFNILRADEFHFSDDRRNRALCGIALLRFSKKPVCFRLALACQPPVSALRKPGHKSADEKPGDQREKQKRKERRLPGQKWIAWIERIGREQHWSPVRDGQGNQHNGNGEQDDEKCQSAQHSAPFWLWL